MLHHEQSQYSQVTLHKLYSAATNTHFLYCFNYKLGNGDLVPSHLPRNNVYRRMSYFPTFCSDLASNSVNYAYSIFIGQDVTGSINYRVADTLLSRMLPKIFWREIASCASYSLHNVPSYITASAFQLWLTKAILALCYPTQLERTDPFTVWQERAKDQSQCWVCREQKYRETIAKNLRDTFQLCTINGISGSTLKGGNIPYCAPATP